MGVIDNEGFDEIMYTQRLADNNVVTRNRTMKSLKKFLSWKSQHKGKIK